LDNEKCIERITDFFQKIADAEINPVSIGGDHAITGGILQGIAGKNSKLTKGKKAAILHFDAHLDSYHTPGATVGSRASRSKVI